MLEGGGIDLLFTLDSPSPEIFPRDLSWTMLHVAEWNFICGTADVPVANFRRFIILPSHTYTMEIVFVVHDA